MWKNDCLVIIVLWWQWPTNYFTYQGGECKSVLSASVFNST